MTPLRIPATAAGGASIHAGRPDIDHLLDHTANIRRPVESLGVARETRVVHAFAHVAVACAVNRKRTVLTEAHGGITPAGGRSVYFPAGLTLLEQDVIELLTGPEAPALLEVESRATPRGHHIEVSVTQFQGKLVDP
jgi:hypothetical protein